MSDPASLAAYVQDAVIDAIALDTYQSILPNLKPTSSEDAMMYSWQIIGHPETSQQQLKNLEAQGDAVVNAAITVLVCNLYPYISAHERTVRPLPALSGVPY